MSNTLRKIVELHVAELDNLNNHLTDVLNLIHNHFQYEPLALSITVSACPKSLGVLEALRSRIQDEGFDMLLTYFPAVTFYIKDVVAFKKSVLDAVQKKIDNNSSQERAIKV